MLPFASATAQDELLSREISEWFLEERFIIADQNEDALLDRDELRLFAIEFAYYLEPRSFEATDKNRDGYLSYHEIKSRVQSEATYRYNQDRKDLRNLALTYPLLQQADIRYLKDNPALVTSLFGNLTWMYENADLAKKIYSDKLWLDAHPEALLSLHRNLRWMAANPATARNLYRERTSTQFLPELLAWRADHMEFIRKHPRMDQFYDFIFIPEGIRIER